jgi:type II secretory pathway pseudopilin PulG
MKYQKNFRHKTSTLEAAFTLVELAIVIVIIGLLVAGVMQGQALIEQAKINRTITDVQSYDAAAVTFRSKYNAIPGDFNKAGIVWGEVSANCTTEAGTGTQTCNGNGDNMVYYHDQPNGHESLRFWQHLSNAKLVKGSYTGVRVLSGNCNTSYCVERNVNVPPSAVNASIIGFFYTRNHTWTGKPVPRHVYTISIPYVASSLEQRWWGPLFTPEQQLMFDTKFDDGKPFQGRIVDMSHTNFYPECTTSEDSDADYNLSYNRMACIPFIDAQIN